MSRRVVTIDPDAPVSRAAEQLAERDVGALAVCGPDRRLRSVITDRDIVVRILAQGLDPEALTAGECATKEPVTVSPFDTLDRAVQRMDEHQVRRLPVVQAGRLVGIVSQSDLAAGGADRQTGRLLARMARMGGDRSSADWLLGRGYRADDQAKGSGRTGGSDGSARHSTGARAASTALAPLVESTPSAYFGGIAIGILFAALALLGLGPPH